MREVDPKQCFGQNNWEQELNITEDNNVQRNS